MAERTPPTEIDNNTSRDADVPSRGTSRGWRSREALTLYLAYAIGAGAINGMGALMIPLQMEQNVSREAVALYSSLYSIGMILVGLIGRWMIRRIGMRRLVALSMILTIVGAGLFWVPWRPITLPGAVLVGFGGAIISLVLPVRLAELHPARAPRALGEATAVASTSSVIFPVMIASALAVQLGWRVGYLVPIILLSLVVLAVRLRDGLTDTVGHLPTTTNPQPLPRLPFLIRLADIPLAVAAEFAFVFWAATAVVEWHGKPTEEATFIGSLFLVGMAIGRTVSGTLFDRMTPRAVLHLGNLTALVGIVLFWTSSELSFAMVGLILAGIGISVLYPASMTRLIAAWPEHRERSSQYAALALGLSVGLAPALLAFLASVWDMRNAFLVVPFFVIVLSLKNLREGPGDTPLA